MYKLQNDRFENPCAVTIVGQNISIPFAPANTDYANFKKQILADEAQLQDSEGVTMSAAEAKAYIAALPQHLNNYIIN